MKEAAGQAASVSASGNRPGRWIVFAVAGAALCCVAYVASFFVLRATQPGIINSNDGPLRAYQRFYHPLRAMTAGHHALMRHWWQASGQRVARVTVSTSPEVAGIFISEEGGPTYRTWTTLALPLWDQRTGIARITWVGRLECLDDFSDWWRAEVVGFQWLEPPADIPPASAR